MTGKRLLSLLSLALCIAGGDGGAAAATLPRYTITAWNDLGMHCIDHDYSVFAILPPFNNLHAQVVDRFTGKRIGSAYGCR